jgi:osmotically inducible protein OsmC
MSITGSPLVCEARVPGVASGTFIEHANAAKAGCRVSQALVGVEMRLDA